MYEVSSVLATILQARYPGGLQSFRDDGGSIDILNGDPCQVFIYYPNLKDFPSEIKEILTGIMDRARIKLTFTDFKLGVTDGNYMDITHHVISILSNAGIPSLNLRYTDMCLIMTPTVIVSASTFEKAIQEIQKEIPEITRIALVKSSGKVLIYETPPKAAPEPVVYLEDLPARNTAISADDITDLKIMLGTIDSVDDFINSL